MTSIKHGKEYFKMLKSAFELETCSYSCEVGIEGTDVARLQRYPYITVLDRLGEGETREKYTQNIQR